MKILKPVLYVVLALLATVVLVLVLLAIAPPRWLGEQASRLGSSALGVPLNIEALDIRPFSLTPAVQATAVDLGAEPAPLQGLNARVSADLLAALRGRLLFDEIAVSDARLTYRRAADGSSNLDQVLASLGGKQPAEPPPGPESSSEPLSLPAIRSLSVTDTTLSVQDAINGGAAELMLRADGSTVDAEMPLTALIDGEVTRNGNDVPASLEAVLGSITPLQDGIGDLDVDVQARLGSLAASVIGQVENALDAAALDAELMVSGDTLDALQALSGVELPAVPAFELIGSVSNEGDELRLQGIDATLGDSAFEGDVRLDPSTAPVTLFANIIFSALDLDELLAIAVGEGVENAEQDEGERADEGVVAPGSDNWFPDRALGLKQLSGAFDGQVRLRASGIDSTWPLDSVDVGIAMAGERIKLEPMELSLANGGVAGEIDIDAAGERPEGSMEFRLQRLEMVRIVEALGIDDDSAGVLGGRLRYWFAGDTIADIVGSVDGGTFLLMTGGKLDALLTELVGVDVVESVMLLADPGKTLTSIDCAYLDVLAKQGVVDIERFVVDTSDTVIIADGTVDRGAQSFDLALEPHAKDASLISGQGPVAISSEGGELSVRPGPDMVARAALAGLLGTVATPAAALLPFIRAGSGEDSVYCEGLVETLDEERK